MSKHREVIHQTRETVLHKISKHREKYVKQRGVFHMKSKHREVIYQTRGVFYVISKHLEVMHQTREEVFHLIFKHREKYIKHEKKCFIWYQTLRSNISDKRRNLC